MSRVRKSVVSTLKVVESQIRCARYCFTVDQPLDAVNQRFIADLYTVMACIWFDVSLNPALVNKRWVSALCSEPVSRVVSLLKDVDYWLVSQNHTTYDGFKRHLQADYPGVGQLISPLSRNIAHFYEVGEGLPRLRTALRFATRANFPSPLGLEEKAWEDWQEICLSPWNKVNVQPEAEALRRIFPRGKGIWNIENFLGRFGPGASCDARDTSLLAKYQSVKTDPMLDFIGLHVGIQPCDMPICNTEPLERVGRLHFVPKQLDKLRTVTMEPAVLMFYQLGGFRWITDVIRRSPWRSHIDLQRADLNQDLAWLGSLDGSYATIDLSSASDCVKLDLVKALTSKTSLYELLIGTRSRLVEYNGQVYRPEYFAPMGSGLCFPVECLTFASIVDEVMRHNGDRRAWRVYGDDIIVPSDRYDETTDRLRQLGFKPNADKSFSGPPGFRESCGGDYFLGENVRPVYVSRFWQGLCYKKRHKPSLIESNIDLANRLFDYKAARLRVIEGLLAVQPPVLFDSDGESGLFTPTPTNYRAKSRWNEDLQRTEYLCGQTKNRREKDKLEHEGIRLFETLRAMEGASACAEHRPISISRSLPPTWSGAWRNPG